MITLHSARWNSADMFTVAQRWQQKACQAPVRDEGRFTRSIGDAFLVIGGLCVLARFLARWKLQGNQIGWDDWTILLTYLLIIPSSVLVQESTTLTPRQIFLEMLTNDFSDVQWYGPRHLDSPL